MPLFPEVTLLDDFKRIESPLSNGARWSILSGYPGTGELGSHWRAKDATDGAYWNAAQYKHPGVAITIIPGSEETGEEVYLWLCMPEPGSAQTGFRLTIRCDATPGTGAWTLISEKVVAGVATNKTETAITLLPSQLGFSEQDGVVTVWGKDTGWEIIHQKAVDSFTEGYVGFAANGRGPLLINFEAGEGTEEPEQPPLPIQRNPFTYPAVDLLTQDPLDPLPYTSVSFGREVNHPGAWAGQLLISDPKVQKLNYLGANNTGSTALFVDYLGKLIWGGVIWTRRYKQSTKTLLVGAQEFGSYFQQRLQAKDYSETWEGEANATDPLVICETIINDAQNREAESDVAPAKIMGGIPLVINRAEPGAPPVQVSYPGTQLQTIDSIVSTLSQMGFKAGFDYSFDVAYLEHTKTPAVTLNFWYPRQGKEAAESTITILGADCVDWEWPEDSSKQANLIFATGSGTGGVQPERASAAPPGYPLLEATSSHTQIISAEVLANISHSELAQRVWPVTTPQIVLPVPMPDAEGNISAEAFGFDSFELGDDLQFRVDPVAGGGRNTDPRFPKGMRFGWRATNWQCQVADKGQSTLTFNVSTPPVETGLLPPQPPLR